MFIKEVTLKRNGWYIQLLHYVFPRVPLYNNFCPIFWLTVLALVFVPFVFTFKSIIRFFSYIVDLFLTPIKRMLTKISLFFDFLSKKSKENSREKAKRKALAIIEKDKDEIEKAFFLNNNCHSDEYYGNKCESKRLRKLWEKLINYKYESASNEIYDKIREITMSFDEKKWSDYFEKQRKQTFEKELLKQQQEKEREKIRKEKAEKNKIFYAKLINLSKYISVALLIIVGSIISYFLFFFLGWLWYWISYFFIDYCNWQSILSIMKDTFIVLILGIIVGGFIFLIIKGIIKLFSNVELPSFSLPIGFHKWLCDFSYSFSNYFESLVLFLSKIFSKIGTVFSFFIVGLKTFKSDNCPHVNWKD